MLLPQSVVRVTLDVRDVENQLSFSVKQNDSVRRIIVNLTDKGKPYLIGVGCYAVFSATTSKNTVISNGCQIKNNEIIYDLSETDTAVVGRMDAEITLFGKDDEVLSAPSFTINVYKSKIGEYAGEVVASNDYSTLKNLIGETNSRIAEVDAILKSDGRVIEDAFREAISGIDEHAADVVDSLPDAYTDIANDVKIHQKEIWARPSGTIFRDAATAHKKTVPANALPVAKIVKIGGMTYNDGGVLKSAPSTKIESVGANLLPVPYVDGSGSKNGVNFVVNADGSVSFTGTATEYINYIFSKTKIFEHGKTYSLSNDVIVFYRDAEGTAKYGEATLTWNSAYTLLQIYAYIPEGAVSKTIYPMISERQSENEEPRTLPYKPYNRAVFSIPEALRNLEGYGDGISEEHQNYIDFEKKQYVQSVKKVVFDGSEDEGISVELIGADYTMFNLNVSGGYDYSRAISNYDIPFRVGYDTNDAHFYVSAKFVSVSMPVGIGRTVGEFKEYLRNNPLHVVYRLASPVITNISDILPADNFIWANRDGSLTFVNEYGYAIPSEVVYYLEAVSGVMVGGAPALKVGDTIITEERIKMLVENGGFPARISEVTILADKWVGEESPYSQVVQIAGVTENSQVDLTPSVEQLAIFHNKDLAFVTENDGGVVTVYAVGEKPTNDYTIQVTITEVYA